MVSIRGVVLCLLAGGLPLTATAGSAGHAPHVHGLAHLDVAVDGPQVALELRSPAANIVGFEHAPSTPAQVRSLEEALQRLRAGTGLFRLDPAADCVLEQASAERHTGDSGEQRDEHEHEHHDHGHAHGEAEDRAAEDGAVHSEIHASYRFRCADPARLQSLQVELQKHFPGIETLETQVVTRERQYGTKLRGGRTELAL